MSIPSDTPQVSDLYRLALTRLQVTLQNKVRTHVDREEAGRYLPMIARGHAVCRIYAISDPVAAATLTADFRYKCAAAIWMGDLWGETSKWLLDQELPGEDYTLKQLRNMAEAILSGQVGELEVGKNHVMVMESYLKARGYQVFAGDTQLLRELVVRRLTNLKHPVLIGTGVWQPEDHLLIKAAATRPSHAAWKYVTAYLDTISD